jgi:glycosyltransferase involved in cell wall biosynthesis
MPDGCQNPLVSIGLPVFNGGATLRRALDSLLAQTYTNFELIISDNASSDKTESICLEYSQKDNRVRYVKQNENQGAVRNFKFVFEESKSEYFMWAGADDVRSPDFLKLNLEFLINHSEYVASTSPNCFEDEAGDWEKMIDFDLDDEFAFERFIKFFQYCWISHGIFYSLIRSEVIRNYPLLSESFLGFDWVFNLHLILTGKVNRTMNGCTLLGRNGASMNPDFYRNSRNRWFEYFLPFYKVSEYTIRFGKGMGLLNRARLITVLLNLSVRVNIARMKSVLYAHNIRKDVKE